MTTAVCWKCGVIKFGAFVPCPECHGTPATDDELAFSLAMTDHYFDSATLERIGALIKEGNPPKLDPQTYAGLIETIRASKSMLPEMQDEVAGALKPAPAPSLQSRKPWWKLW